MGKQHKNRMGISSLELRLIVREWSDDQCCICGCIADPKLFHHVEGNSVRVGQISSLIGGCIEVLWEELKKCEVICRKCHTKLHGVMRKSYDKYSFSNADYGYTYCPIYDHFKHRDVCGKCRVEKCSRRGGN